MLKKRSRSNAASVVLGFVLAGCGAASPTGIPLTPTPGTDRPIPAGTDRPTPERTTDLSEPTALTGSDETEPTASHEVETTVVIEGVEYDCATLAYGLRTARVCGEIGQYAFDRWGPRLDDFLTSDLLASALRGVRPIEAPPLASYALYACLISDGRLDIGVEGSSGESYRPSESHSPLDLKIAAFYQAFAESFPQVESEKVLRTYLAMTNDLCPETLQ